MAGLLDLPPEMLRMIIEFLFGEDCEQRLCGLCLTSRRLLEVAQPLLFAQYIEVEPSVTSYIQCYRVGSSKNGEEGDYDVFSRALFRFVRTVVSRPDLASGVRIVQVYYNPQLKRYWKRQSDAPHPPVEDVEVLVRAAATLPKADKQLLLDMKRMAPADILTLFLFRIPKLEVFNLADYCPSGTFEALRSLARLQEWRVLPTLEHLKRIELGSYFLRDFDSRIPFSVDFFDIKDIVPILRLPSLQSFAALAVRGKGLSQHGPDLMPVGSLCLSELHLMSSDLDADSLGILIRACRSLKVFRYSEDLEEVDVDRVNAQNLFQILLGQRQWLKELGIEWMQANKMSVNSYQPLLHAFPALEKVTFGYPFGPDFEFLAGSVSDVTLLHCDSGSGLFLINLPTFVTKYLPRLQTITVSADENCGLRDLFSIPYSLDDKAFFTKIMDAYQGLQKLGVKLISYTDDPVDIDSLKRGSQALVDEAIQSLAPEIGQEEREASICSLRQRIQDVLEHSSYIP